MDHDHGFILGKVDAGVRTGDRLVVPVCDLAQENACQRFRSELDFSANAGNVVGRNHRTQYRRDMQDLRFSLSQLLVSHGAITGSEVDGAGQDLTNTAAASDRLVVKLNIRMS